MQHGFWCGARTIPMRCRRCHAHPIFWFSCDCGCSVLFEELGPPWPRHECYADGGRVSPDSVEEAILAPARLPWMGDMSAVPPARAGEELDIVGVVGNRVLERNVTKMFGVADTPTGRLLLGPLGNFRPGTVTVHVVHPSVDGQPLRRESVTAWTSRTKLRTLRVGDPVRMKVVARRIQDELVWIVNSLKVIFGD